MLGILCGLKSEEMVARTIPGALVANAASRPDLARKRTRDLIADGATHLLSFGVGGALSPYLYVGDYFLATHIISEDKRWTCDQTWIDNIKKMMPMIQMGMVYGSDKLLETAEEKKLAFAKTNCMVVDMESHVMAEVALEHHIPFTAIRVVADMAAMDLPPVVRVPMRADGGINGWGVFKSILSNPTQIPKLVALGRDSKQAIKSMEEIAGYMNRLSALTM